MTTVYGDLGQDARFAEAFGRHLNRLWAVGTRQTLTEFLDELGPASAPMADESPFAPRGEPQSLVLRELDESRRPKARTVCEHCPNSVWFSSPTEVKAYCRVMFLVVWSNKEPQQITGCDGMFLGEE